MDHGGTASAPAIFVGSRAELKVHGLRQRRHVTRGRRFVCGYAAAGSLALHVAAIAALLLLPRSPPHEASAAADVTVVFVPFEPAIATPPAPAVQTPTPETEAPPEPSVPAPMPATPEPTVPTPPAPAAEVPTPEALPEPSAPEAIPAPAEAAAALPLPPPPPPEASKTPRLARPVPVRPAERHPAPGEAPPASIALAVFIPPRPVAGMADNHPPAYPESARRRGLQGRVVLRVSVSTDGIPLSITVAASSGAASLDDAAEAAVRQWHFVPASQANRPVPGTAEVPIVFKLE